MTTIYKGYKYEFCSGDGDSGNSLFRLETDSAGYTSLRTRVPIDYEAYSSMPSPFVTIRVRVTDERNNSFEKKIQLNILDVPETPSNVNADVVLIGGGGGAGGKDDGFGGSGGSASSYTFSINIEYGERFGVGIGSGGLGGLNSALGATWQATGGAGGELYNTDDNNGGRGGYAGPAGSSGGGGGGGGATALFRYQEGIPANLAGCDSVWMDNKFHITHPDYGIIKVGTTPTLPQKSWRFQAHRLSSFPDYPGDGFCFQMSNITSNQTYTFSKPVMNPILAMYSLGNPGNNVKIISDVECRDYSGGAKPTGDSPLNFPDKFSFQAREGYGMVMFPGEHSSITLKPEQAEHYYDLVWGVQYCKKVTAFYPIIAAAGGGGGTGRRELSAYGGGGGDVGPNQAQPGGSLLTSDSPIISIGGNGYNNSGDGPGGGGGGGGFEFGGRGATTGNSSYGGISGATNSPDIRISNKILLSGKNGEISGTNKKGLRTIHNGVNDSKAAGQWWIDYDLQPNLRTGNGGVSGNTTTDRSTSNGGDGAAIIRYKTLNFADGYPRLKFGGQYSVKDGYHTHLFTSGFTELEVELYE